MQDFLLLDEHFLGMGFFLGFLVDSGVEVFWCAGEILRELFFLWVFV